MAKEFPTFLFSRRSKAMMNYRTLGRTGLTVSAMGFGGGGIGQVWGPTTDEECVRAVRKAFDLGINFFDVAPSYGRGKAEENLGKGLKAHRDQAVIATKVRLRNEHLTDVEAAVRSSLEESLRLLQTEWVDLLQLHNRIRNKRLAQDASLGAEDVLGSGGVLEAFRRLQQEGKVRFVGITGYGDIESLAEVIESGGFDTVQIHYNIIHQNCLGSKTPVVTEWPQPLGILPLAGEHNLGVIGIRSLAAGALTDAVDRPYQPDSELAGDVRKAEALRFLLKGPARTLSQAAMLFVLMSEQIHTQVPGFKSVAEVEEAVGCLDLPPLSRSDLENIEKQYGDNFGVVSP
ncbi:MAG: aldo/keto reductase [Dehalococcoidia bacterium]|nr:aldo/keto reductase [Dehalococcoidia bacterium]